MKTLFFVSVLFAVVHSEEQLKSGKLQTNKPQHQHELQSRPFTVKLDHFTPQDSRHVKFVSEAQLFYTTIPDVLIQQTYVQNLNHFRLNGPLFVFINDNDVFTTELLLQGLMYDIAAEAGGALITADNRFFRSNLPTV